MSAEWPDQDRWWSRTLLNKPTGLAILGLFEQNTKSPKEIKTKITVDMRTCTAYQLRAFRESKVILCWKV